jgi:protein-S-isoprenylcysteine O-methyltransferase Ste14
MTDSLERDGAAVRLPPPLVYLIAVIAGALLQMLAPLRLEVSLTARVCGAVLAALLGLIVVGAAIRQFRRTGQDPAPWESTPEILSAGIYRHTRNPMYLGMALLQLAIGVGWGNLWIVALVPLVLAVVYVTAVRHEEAYLERKFGEGYRSYKEATRRWL